MASSVSKFQKSNLGDLMATSFFTLKLLGIGDHSSKRIEKETNGDM